MESEVLDLFRCGALLGVLQPMNDCTDPGLSRWQREATTGDETSQALEHCKDETSEKYRCDAEFTSTGKSLGSDSLAGDTFLCNPIGLHPSLVDQNTPEWDEKGPTDLLKVFLGRKTKCLVALHDAAVSARHCSVSLQCYPDTMERLKKIEQTLASQPIEAHAPLYPLHQPDTSEMVSEQKFKQVPQWSSLIMVYITDYSTNGTFLNGKRLRKHVPTLWEPHDAILTLKKQETQLSKLQKKPGLVVPGTCFAASFQFRLLWNVLDAETPFNLHSVIKGEDSLNASKRRKIKIDQGEDLTLATENIPIPPQNVANYPDYHISPNDLMDTTLRKSTANLKSPDVQHFIHEEPKEIPSPAYDSEYAASVTRPREYPRNPSIQSPTTHVPEIQRIRQSLDEAEETNAVLTNRVTNLSNRLQVAEEKIKQHESEKGATQDALSEAQVRHQKQEEVIERLRNTERLFDGRLQESVKETESRCSAFQRHNEVLKKELHQKNELLAKRNHSDGLLLAATRTKVCDSVKIIENHLTELLSVTEQLRSGITTDDTGGGEAA